MSTLAVIPARLAASRLPRKPLRLLAGTPLVLRVWERITALALVDRVVIATDSEEVVGVARAVGAEAVLTRADHPSGTDRVAEAACRSELAEHDVIVNVQGDEPFLDGDALGGAIALVTSGRFPLATAAALAEPRILGTPSVVKVVCADDGRALYFSRAGIPYLRDRSDAERLRGVVRHHIGLYAYTREALARWVALPPHPLELVERLEQLRPLAAGLPMGVATIARTPQPGIDTEDDLQRANDHWTDLIAGRT